MSFYFNPNSTSTQFFLDSNQHSISGTSQGFNALCLSNQIHNNTRLREQFIYENKVLFMNDPNLSKIFHIVLSSLGNIHHEILTRSNFHISTKDEVNQLVIYLNIFYKNLLKDTPKKIKKEVKVILLNDPPENFI